MNERRLIDANALRDKCLTWLHTDSQQADEQDDMAASVIMEIDAAPTVDAEPVRRGRWMKSYRSGYTPKDGKPICSECDCWSDGRTPYCARCGAWMDGVSE